LYDLIEKYFVEIIGLLGTLLGVLLGAFLNRISRYGRVKFYVNDVKHNLSERDDFGGFKSVESITPKTESLSINIDLDLINTSEYSKKLLRDIKFLSVNKNYNKTKIIKDNSTRRMSSSLILVDDLKFINLQPKEIRNLNLSIHFKEDFEKILNSDWYLEYRKLNNKKRKIKINK